MDSDEILLDIYNIDFNNSLNEVDLDLIDNYITNTPINSINKKYIIYLNKQLEIQMAIINYKFFQSIKSKKIYYIDNKIFCIWDINKKLYEFVRYSEITFAWCNYNSIVLYINIPVGLIYNPLNILLNYQHF